MSAAEREREIAKLKAELAALVEASNAEGDSETRVKLIGEVRALRAFLSGLPGCDLEGEPWPTTG